MQDSGLGLITFVVGLKSGTYLSNSGMNANRHVKVLLGGSKFHAYGKALRHLTSIGTQYVETDHLLLYQYAHRNFSRTVYTNIIQLWARDEVNIKQILSNIQFTG